MDIAAWLKGLGLPQYVCAIAAVPLEARNRLHKAELRRDFASEEFAEILPLRHNSERVYG
jgi:hypothetical protein